jgi:hypothetical protein
MRAVRFRGWRIRSPSSRSELIKTNIRQRPGNAGLFCFRSFVSQISIPGLYFRAVYFQALSFQALSFQALSFLRLVFSGLPFPGRLVVEPLCSASSCLAVRSLRRVAPKLMAHVTSRASVFLLTPFRTVNFRDRCWLRQVAVIARAGTCFENSNRDRAAACNSAAGLPSIDEQKKTRLRSHLSA